MPAPRRSVRINKKFKIDPDTAVVSSTESRVSDDDFQEPIVSSVRLTRNSTKRIRRGKQSEVTSSSTSSQSGILADSLHVDDSVAITDFEKEDQLEGSQKLETSKTEADTVANETDSKSDEPTKDLPVNETEANSEANDTEANFEVNETETETQAETPSAVIDLSNDSSSSDDSSSNNSSSDDSDAA
ncbi:hypothetical protein G6F56_005113 [Rhizopus delemar]|nr:hypothetical protein G6F56_005113 [Rhizopus delemar]